MKIPDRVDIVVELTEEAAARFLETRELLIEHNFPVQIKVVVRLPGCERSERDCAELRRLANL